MKVLYVFLLLCILSIYAQRRLTKHDSSDLEPTPQKSIRSRGRTRFSITPEFENVSEDYELVKKDQIPEAPRRQPERKPHRLAHDAIFSRRSYEVQEIVDDIPSENPPRLKKKPHVVTEMKFEAANAPPKETAPPENDVPVSKPAEPVSTEKSTEASVEHTSAAIPDLKHKSTETPEVRRFHPRGRQLPPKTEEPPASRSRLKPVQKQPGTHTTAATTPHRSSSRVQRRRPEPTAETAHDSLRTKGPSVFSAESAHEFPSRARTGRKVVTQGDEDVTENTVVLRRRPSRRPKPLEPVTAAPKAEQNVIEQDASPLERKVESRRTRLPTSMESSTTTRSSRRGATRVHQDVEATTIRQQRTRTRSKSDSASVVTTPTRAFYSRRRQPTSIDDIDAASTKQTEVKVKVAPPPDFESPNVKVSLQRTISEETQPGRIVRKRLHQVRKSPTKANEIVEPTPSADTFDAPRKFDLLNLRQNEERGPRPSQQTIRKTSRSGQAVEGASRSQESIDESDNYPAAFKAAIIQAKKKKHGLLGSRTLTANEASVTKTVETTTVTSSISSTSSRSSFPYPDAVTSAALKKDEESSTVRASRYPRPRFSLTTKQPKTPEKERENRKYTSYKSKYSNPAVEHEHSSTTQKYHARYHAKIQNDIDVTVPPKPLIKTRNYIPKPPKGIFSSRRSATEEKPIKIETSSLSTKVPPVGLSARNRFSARYRNEILPKSVAHRQATNVPTYTPTVPTVTPPSSTIKIEDTVQGLEVISFYDPVSNMVQSANLVNGDVVTSVSDNSTSQSTERQMTIIERIINSITAISTTASPDSTTVTTTHGQTTKGSAILNLVAKRSKDASLDVTQMTLQNITTEKPTTLIEQILSSLSVIRADSATIDSNQVGTTLVSTQASAQSLEILGTTPLSINNSSSDDTTLLSTTSVLSTAPYTETTNTAVSLDELNTIPTRAVNIKPRLLYSDSVAEVVTTEEPTSVAPRANLPTSSDSSTTDDGDMAMLYTSAIENETENPQIAEIVSAVSKIVASTLEPSTSSSTTVMPPTVTVQASSAPESTESPVFTLTDYSQPPTLEIESSATTTAETTMVTETMKTDPPALPVSLSNPTTGQTVSIEGQSSTTMEMLSRLTVTDSTVTQTSSSAPNVDTTPSVAMQSTLLSQFPDSGPTTASTEALSPTETTDSSTVPIGSPSASSLPASTQTTTSSSQFPYPGVASSISSLSTDATVTMPTQSIVSSSQFPYPGASTTTVSFPPSDATVTTLSTSSAPMSTMISISSDGTVTQSTVPSSEFPYPAKTTENTDLTVPSSRPTSTMTSLASDGTVTQSTQFPYPAKTADTDLTVPSSTPTSTMTSLPSDGSVTQSTVPMSQFPYPAKTTNTDLPKTTLPSAMQSTTSQSPDSTATPFSIPTDLTTETILLQSATTPRNFPYPSVSNNLIAQSSTISEVSVPPNTTPITTATTLEQKSNTATTTEDSSTMHSLSNFEVSPDRVSIYSPNDISSTFLPDEPAFTTVSISGRVLTTTPVVNSTTTTSKPYPNTELSTNTNTTDETSQDVSSNTINTNSATDKTDISNLINQLSLTTNAVESSTTSTTADSRDGRRLSFEIPPATNDISEPPEKDYYIFAVLQNNTVLRKRPSRFPNKNTPFLIYGVLPNNTLIQKFPNGTIVPMEPVIQVNGFDTREFPPTQAAELISNQVTTTQEPQRNNKPVTIEAEANELSARSGSAAPSLPPIVQLLGGKTVSEFNNIINKTKEVQTLDVDSLLESRSTKTDVPSTSSTTVATTTTSAPFTSPPETTTVTSTSTSTVSTTTAETTTPALTTEQADVDVAANALGLPIQTDSPTTQTPPPFTLMDLLTKATTPPTSTVVSVKDLKVDESKLTDQQRQDWEILKALEREQEAILKQLSFLTRLNLGGTKSGNADGLANRVVAQAVESDNRQSKELSEPSSDERLENEISTSASAIVSSTYGKTNDALLASLLKEYGVGPTTPKGFSDAFTKALFTTTKPPTRKPTTQAPGPLMQGLNWLLNTLSPQTTLKPKPKPKPTTPAPIQTEALSAAPQSKPRSPVITDKHLEMLIQQLEAIQKDPKKAKNLDIEALRKLQSMSRITATTTTKSPVENEITPVLINRGNLGVASTPLPLSVTNNQGGLKATASTINQSRLPPVKLNPVPGVPDESPMIRGQLVNYAINITKAISSFLGTALQDASNRFVNIVSSGSGNQLFNSSFDGSALPSSSSG